MRGKRICLLALALLLGRSGWLFPEGRRRGDHGGIRPE